MKRRDGTTFEFGWQRWNYLKRRNRIPCWSEMLWWPSNMNPHRLRRSLCSAADCSRAGPLPVFGACKWRRGWCAFNGNLFGRRPFLSLPLTWRAAISCRPFFLRFGHTKVSGDDDDKHFLSSSTLCPGTFWTQKNLMIKARRRPTILLPRRAQGNLILISLLGDLLKWFSSILFWLNLFSMNPIQGSGTL